jgi:hypothetical protein
MQPRPDGESGHPPAAEAAEPRYPGPRPISHPEEGEGGRGEWWALLKAVAIGALIVMLIGWLISL